MSTTITSGRRPYYLSGVSSKPIDWIWPGRLARGMITILESDPGMGKGFIAMDIAARLTTARPMPCVESSSSSSSSSVVATVQNTPESFIPHCLRRKAKSVLLCSTEDSPEFAQKVRAEAAGANLDRIVCLDPSIRADYEGGMVAVDDTLHTIAGVCRQVRPALIVIDPLFGFIQALTHAGEKDARFILAALSQIAERCNVAILAIRHLSKQRRSNAIHRGSGSIAFSAGARIVLAIDTLPSPISPMSTMSPEHPTSNTQHLRTLICIKSNIAQPAVPLTFEIVPAPNGSAKVNWLGQSKIQNLKPKFEAIPSKAKSVRIAADFVLQALANGPVDEIDVRIAAAERGISQKTLRRAKTVLGVRVHPPTFRHRKWQWFLPVEPSYVQENQMATSDPEVAI